MQSTPRMAGEGSGAPQAKVPVPTGDFRGRQLARDPPLKVQLIPQNPLQSNYMGRHRRQRPICILNSAALRSPGGL